MYDGPYKDFFKERLPELRQNKDISAREMSLSLGCNPGYINNIECGKALPAMHNFFYICEYLNISPSEFFQREVNDPEQLSELIGNLKKLNPEELDSINTLVRNMCKKK